MRKQVFLLVVPAILLLVLATIPSLPRVNAQPGNWIIAAQPTPTCITSGLCRVGHPDVTFPSGQGGSSILQMNATGGFTGTITLSTAVTPNTGALTASCSPNSGIAIGGASGNGTSTCSYTSIIPGSYSVTITGTNGTLNGQHSVIVPVTVISFSMTLTPAGVTFNSTATSSATLNFVNSGFNETVALSATTAPLTGLTVTFTPPSITLNTKTARTATSTVGFSSSVPNVYNVTISGTGTTTGPVVKFNAIVNVLGYTLSPSPNSFIRESWGASLTSTVTVHALTGFTGTVNLFTEFSLGFSSTFTPPAVTLTAGGTQTSTMVLTLGTPSPASVRIIVSGNSTISGGAFQMQVTTNVAVQVIGEICLADPAGFAANAGGACPASPYVFSGPFPSSPAQTGSTQIRVGVFAQGSDSLNGAGVLLYTNRTELKPWNNLAGLDLTGSIIPSPSVFLYCVNDVIVAGPACSNPGIPPPGLATVEAIVTTSGSGGTPQNATGLLFTLVFNVTANTIPLGHPITFASGCGATSAPGGVCVTVSAGATGKDPENFQAGNFTSPSPATIPWVAISSSVPSITIAKGGVATATITVTSQNGYAVGFFSYTDLVSFSSVVTTGFTAPTFAPTSCSTAGVSCISTMTASTTTPGTYFITVRATYGTQDASGNFQTLVGTVTIVVNIEDYTYAFSPGTVDFATGGSAVATSVTTSLGGINGAMTVTAVCNVAATLTINGFACSTAATTVASFTLTAGGSVTTQYTFTSAAAAGHKVLFILTPHLGTVTHPFSGTALINDFTFTASTPVSFTTGGSGTSNLSLGSLGGSGIPPMCTTTCGFAGLVTFSPVGTPATGLIVTCPSVTLAAGGSTTGSCSFISAAPGTYSVVITASGGSPAGSITHTQTVSVTVSGNFTISASPNPVSISGIGGTGTSAITVASVNGLAGNVAFPATGLFVNRTGLACTLTPASATIGGAASTLSCLASTSGSFKVTITGVFTGTDGLTLTNNFNVTYSVSAVQPDFSISASAVSPSSVLATNAGASTIMITPSNGFTGTVTFTVSASTPAGLTCTTPVSVTGGSGTSTLSCIAAVGGDYSVIVTGSSGTLSHPTGTILFHVVDFSISGPAITSLATVAGTSTVTVTPINSFTGTVTFTAGTVPSGCTASFTGAVLSVNCTTGVAPFSVTVTGTTGTTPSILSRTTSVSVTIQDFSLSAPAITTLATVSGTSTVTVTSINGFTGTVTFTAGTVPTGCTASFTGAVLSATCSTGVAPFSVVVTGMTGTAPNTLSRTANVAVTVQDFSLSAPAITALATVSGTSTVAVTPINGFAGTVTFTAGTVPSGCTPSFAGAVLSIVCTTGVAPFTVVVTGTTGTAPNSLSRTTSVSVTIQDFSLTATPPTIPLATAGTAGTSTISVNPINGFAGTVVFTAGTVPTGCTASFTGAVLSVSCNPLPSSGFNVVVTGTTGISPNTLGRTVTVAVTVPGPNFSISAGAVSPTAILATNTGASTMTITSTGGFTGTVSFTVSSSTPAGLTCPTPTSVTGGSGTTTLSCSATVGGDYTVTVTGNSGTLSHATGSILFHVVDFSISGPAITTLATVAGASTITVAPINGFAGTVTFSTGTVPSGCTASFTGAVLSVSCATGVAPFSVTVTGSTGTSPNTLSRTTSVSVTIQDFSLSAPAITTLATVAGTSLVTVTPINGFTGVVTFAAGTIPSGCSASFTGATLSVTCSTGVAPFSISVAGTTRTAPNTLSRNTSVSATVQDFSLTAPAITTLATIAGASTVTVTPINGFAGTVTFSAGTVPAGCTASFTGAVLSANCATGVAPFSILVTGKAGTAPNTLSRTTDVGVTIQDFTLSATPATIALTTAGTAGTSTISVTPINGFAGTVAFSAGTVPTGCTASFASALLSVSCSPLPASGFTLVVTGSSGTSPNTLSRTVNVSVTVPGPDFSISAGPVSPSAILATTTGSSTITIASSGGFTGTVAFTVSASTPSGLTCTTPASVSGGSGISTLSCVAATGADYSITVTGSSGTLSHPTSSIIFHVVDFSLSAPAITTLATVAGTSTVTVAPINGFTGTVTFTAGSVPSGCTGSFTAAVLSVSCTTGVAPFALMVTGVTGTAPNTLSRMTSVSVTIQDFNLSANPPTIPLIVAGTAGTSTISANAINGFTGTVTFSAGTVPTACTASFAGPILSVSCSPLPTSGFTVVVTGITGTAPNTLSRTLNVPVTVPAGDFSISASSVTPSSILATNTGTSTITITPSGGFIGTVMFTVSASTPAGLACTTPTAVTGGSGTTTLSCSATVGGDYTVTVTGASGALSHTTSSITFHVVDFSLSAPAITTLATVSGTSTVTVTPINGFAGTVAFSASSVPNGCSASFSGPVLSVNCTTAVSSFSVIVTGTTGTSPNTLSRTTNVSVTIQDFSIAANPTNITVNTGSAGLTMITVSPINGFNGIVNLSTANAACTITPNSITGSGTATLSCNFNSIQITSVTVTGTISSLTHSVTITYNVTAQTTCGTGCSINSDAKITAPVANATDITFTATGQVGTTAFANVTIPVASVPSITSLQVLLNGTATPFTFTTNGASFFVYFTFTFHSTFTIDIRLSPVSVTPILLTFKGFDLDDFENGIGQFQVFVNGHLVVDIPAGLNHLTGSGDFASYQDRWISFGPFDITQFVVQGQNTILFTDPLLDHEGLVRNVTITQGSTVLLHVSGAREVEPGESVKFTFSNPPLVLTSFTASNLTPKVGQDITFTATYTGGTAPFRCMFFFGDDQSAIVNGVGGVCTVTHQYSFSRTFTVRGVVRGASTSDLVSARLTVTVS